jgi:hypothetical protein
MRADSNPLVLSSSEVEEEDATLEARETIVVEPHTAPKAVEVSTRES